MEQPSLILMAAGLGSRFGGLKQMTPVGDQGEIILDFSLFDAWKAGFRKMIFVIRRENETDFRELIGKRIEDKMDVYYVSQELTDLPDGFSLPEGRTKPWGTGHAVRACRGVVKEPFAVINSDDFYGASAYKVLFDYLTSGAPATEHAMVGYRLRNTVTDNGFVSRGICEEADGYLTSITERVRVEKVPGGIAFTEDRGESYTALEPDTLVSMNFWGFHKNMMDAFDARFEEFLRRDMPQRPEKAEYYLPAVANAEMLAGKAKIRLLPCEETWYGITYREDMPAVSAAIADMKARGIYPQKLWTE